MSPSAAHEMQEAAVSSNHDAVPPPAGPPPGTSAARSSVILDGHGPEEIEFVSDPLGGLVLRSADLGPLLGGLLGRLGLAPATLPEPPAVDSPETAPADTAPPRWLTWRGQVTSLPRRQLRAAPERLLWRTMLGAPGGLPATVAADPFTPSAYANLLDIASELARRQLRACRLCAWRCGVDRTLEPAARCGSSAVARVTRTLDSDGDEPQLGRQLVVWTSGCNWSCAFCQYPAELDARAGAVIRPRALARAVDAAYDRGRSTLHLVGGNPDQHAPTLLRMLTHLTRPARIAWDANASATGVLLTLVPADVWILDLRAGNEACAITLGGHSGAWAATRAAVRRAAHQTAAATIVRHLVIPGHVDCCTTGVAAYLQDLAASGGRFQVSLLEHYRPRHRAVGDAALGRLPWQDELRRARSHFEQAGLPLVDRRA